MPTASQVFDEFRAELRPTLRLALPLVLAELGWMCMTIVDTMMVGRLLESAESIAAVSISSSIFVVFAFCGEGLLIGLDTLVSQAFGAGRREDCHRSFVNGIYLSLALTPILTLPVWFIPRWFPQMGVDPRVVTLAVPYMHTLAIGMLPLLLYFAVRRTLQGMDMVRPIAFALITANVVNVFGNWVLVYGKIGFPALGVTGSGVATAISRTYLSAFLIAYLLWYDQRHKTDLLNTPVEIDLQRIRRLLALGIPAACQITAEVGVFALTASLIARLGPVSQAGHQIALNTVALTYMVPLGISSAAAVRVGQALGRKDAAGAARAGNTAIALGAAFMACMSVALLLLRRPVALAYTHDPMVVGATATLFLAGAAFQLFDGIQVVATGSLRGTGDTRTPMLCHFVLYWFVGLPLGIYLCFGKKWGALGLWIGLCLSLILIGVLLLTFWRRKVQSLRQSYAEVAEAGAEA